MDFLHIIGTIFDDSINHVVALAQQIYDENWRENGKNGDNLQNINQYLLNLIRGVEEKSEHSKGFYSSLTDLQNKVPEPVVGDWGVIETIANGVTKLIICRCSTEGIWTQTLEEITLEVPLGEYIKTNKLKTINNLSLIIEDNGDANINITGGNLEYPVVSTTEDGIVSSNLYLEWITIKTTILPKLREDINSLFLLVDSNPELILEIIAKYNQIKEFIESLNPDDEVLLQIIEGINELRNEILELKDNGNSGIKHVILTKREYNKLKLYEKDTLYIIIENESNAWLLGDTLPIILSSDKTSWGLGDELPIILTEDTAWSFDSKFPIIFT